MLARSPQENVYLYSSKQLRDAGHAIRSDMLYFDESNPRYCDVLKSNQMQRGLVVTHSNLFAEMYCSISDEGEENTHGNKQYPSTNEGIGYIYIPCSLFFIFAALNSLSILRYFDLL